MSPRTGCGTALGLTSTTTTPSRYAGGTPFRSRPTSTGKSSSRTTTPRHECGVWNAECGIEMGGRSPSDAHPYTPQSARRIPHYPFRLPLQPLRQVVHEPLGRDAHLLQRITVPHRDGAVLRGLAVDRDAERRSGLVLATVAAADRAAVVVEEIGRASCRERV